MNRRVLELRLCWDGCVLDVEHHTGVHPVVVGLTGSTAPLFERTKTGWVLHAPAGALGPLEGPSRQDAVDGRAAQTIELDALDHGVLHLRGLVVLWRFVEPRARVTAAPWRNVDLRWVNTLLATCSGAAAFLAVLVLYPQNVHGLEGALDARPLHLTQVLLNPAPRPKPAFVQRLQASQRPVAASRPAGAGSSVPSVRANPQATQPQRHRRSAASVVEQMFGGLNTTTVFQGDGLHEVTAASSNVLRGTLVANATGALALDVRGVGPGRGTAEIHQAGALPRRGAGNGTAANPYGGLPPRRVTEPVVEAVPGTAEVIGALDRDVVRRVIREHLPRIRYCYERALTGHPGLTGKVLTRFTIGPTGLVADATLSEDTLHSAEATTCILNAVRSWEFPKPRGGGVVVVNYPFLFRQGG